MRRFLRVRRPDMRPDRPCAGFSYGQRCHGMCQSDEFREHVFVYGTAGVVESSLVGGRSVKTSHRPPWGKEQSYTYRYSAGALTTPSTLRARR